MTTNNVKDTYWREKLRTDCAAHDKPVVSTRELLCARMVQDNPTISARELIRAGIVIDKAIQNAKDDNLLSSDAKIAARQKRRNEKHFNLMQERREKVNMREKYGK